VSRIHLRLDTDGNPSILQPRPLRRVGNQDLTIDVLVEQLIVSSLPPAYAPVDIALWTGAFVGKRCSEDANTAALWNVAGTLVTDGTDGLMRFTVARTDDDVRVDYGYGELAFTLSGQVIYRMAVPFTLTRPAIGA
jgi:hypothetical protein